MERWRMSGYWKMEGTKKGRGEVAGKMKDGG